mmetsp:Transcript_32864/g.45854  ORF Transcript_32864/g.45854 Transcript_32864/m.45854 type:complete len:168 (+) Transcript_32864:371-874(+)
MLVKWKGYGEEEATWEPIENVHPDLLVEYFLHEMDTMKQKSGGVSFLRDSKSEKDLPRLKAGFRSINRKLRHAEKVCEDLRNQNEVLQRTINQLVDENEVIRKHSKGTSSKSRKNFAREIEILRKEVSSLKSVLRYNRQKQKKKVPSILSAQLTQLHSFLLDEFEEK